MNAQSIRINKQHNPIQAPPDDDQNVQLNTNIQQKQKQKFLGTLLWQAFDLVTFGALEKKVEHKNKTQNNQTAINQTNLTINQIKQNQTQQPPKIELHIDWASFNRSMPPFNYTFGQNGQPSQQTIIINNSQPINNYSNDAKNSTSDKPIVLGPALPESSAEYYKNLYKKIEQENQKLTQRLATSMAQQQQANQFRLDFERKEKEKLDEESIENQKQTSKRSKTHKKKKKSLSQIGPQLSQDDKEESTKKNKKETEVDEDSQDIDKEKNYHEHNNKKGRFKDEPDDEGADPEGTDDKDKDGKKEDPLITYLTIKSKQHRSKLDMSYVESVFESFSIKVECEDDDHCLPGEDSGHRELSKSNSIRAYLQVFKMWKIKLSQEAQQKFQKFYFQQAWNKLNDNGFLFCYEVWPFMKEIMTSPYVRQQIPASPQQTAQILSQHESDDDEPEDNDMSQFIVQSHKKTMNQNEITDALGKFNEAYKQFEQRTQEIQTPEQHQTPQSLAIALNKQLNLIHTPVIIPIHDFDQQVEDETEVQQEQQTETLLDKAVQNNISKVRVAGITE